MKIGVGVGDCLAVFRSERADELTRNQSVEIAGGGPGVHEQRRAGEVGSRVQGMRGVREEDYRVDVQQDIDGGARARRSPPLQRAVMGDPDTLEERHRWRQITLPETVFERSQQIEVDPIMNLPGFD